MYAYEFNRDKNNCVLIADEPRVGVTKHFHNCMEFIYVLENGGAVAHIDGEVFPLSAGQICAVSCFSTHYYEQKHDGHYIVCLIPRRYFRELESVFNINSFANPILNDNEERSLYHTVRMMQNIAGGKDIFGAELPSDANTYAETQLHRLSAYLINLFIRHCGLHERHRISSMVADAVRIIETDFKSDITTATICKKLGCYQKSLSNHFTKTMGMSILRYIERTRVLEAARLLGTNPQMTVEAVMLESGFKSSRSFLRHFKSVYGCTPTEYKNNQMHHQPTKQPSKQANKQTSKQANKQTSKQANKQMNKGGTLQASIATARKNGATHQECALPCYKNAARDKPPKVGT